ncbi:hypothetical protein TNCV_2628591 [Trichonephila clavipes]|uniref:Uncharacterized protein n=1 Tax=Trichonephila clavipes TaxID=2585209 RepID=A0A8X6SF07_TRICX|nr:hypothetical protein TNCV_2628591 [Trichonephila clavipes]
MVPEIIYDVHLAMRSDAFKGHEPSPKFSRDSPLRMIPHPHCSHGTKAHNYMEPQPVRNDKRVKNLPKMARPPHSTHSDLNG